MEETRNIKTKYYDANAIHRNEETMELEFEINQHGKIRNLN